MINQWNSGNVGKTIINHPPKPSFLYKPFPVMGGKDDIVLPALNHLNHKP